MNNKGQAPEGDDEIIEEYESYGNEEAYGGSQMQVGQPAVGYAVSDSYSGSGGSYSGSGGGSYGGSSSGGSYSGGGSYSDGGSYRGSHSYN